MKPLFSIIVPTFNCAAKIEKTLTSVTRDQNGFDDVEILVMDGASSDETASIAREFAAQHARVRVWSEPDNGIYDAMNKGIEKSSGRYLYFLGAGDTLRNGVLRRVAARLRAAENQTAKPALLYGDVWFADLEFESGGPFSAWRVTTTCPNHQTMFTAREIFERRGGFELCYPLAADWAFHLGCWGDANIAKIHFPLVIADYEGGGLSALRRDENFMADLPRLVWERLPLPLGALYRVRRVMPRGVKRWGAPLLRRLGWMPDSQTTIASLPVSLNSLSSLRSIKWVFAYSQGSEAKYEDLIRVAVASARERTALESVCLYDGEPTELTHWLEDQGVSIVPCRSVFRDRLQLLAQECHDPEILHFGSGAFLRFEIPRIAQEQKWHDNFVFYSDCDVMWQGDPAPFLHSLRPRIFAAAPEHTPDSPLHMNSGALWIRVAALRGWEGGLKSFVHRNFSRICPGWWDQTAMRVYFHPLHRFLWKMKIPDRIGYGLLTRVPFRSWKWDDLPLELNWKPYWGENANAVLIHFHGPKPNQRPQLDRGECAPILQNLDGEGFRFYARQWDEWLEGAHE